jgi:hypothetical protein
MVLLSVFYTYLFHETVFAMEADRMGEIPDLNLPLEPENPIRAPNPYIEALRRDETLCPTFRTACIKQELLIEQMSLLLQGQGVPENDIRSGVDLHLTDLMNEEPGCRNQRLAYTVKTLVNKGQRSSVFRKILKDIVPSGSVLYVFYPCTAGCRTL